MRILLCFDGSEHAVAAGELLARLPLPESAEITVLNVIELQPPFATFDTLSGPDREALREIESRLHERGEALVAGEADRLVALGRTGPTVHRETVSGELPDAILQAADRIGADWIVLGAKGTARQRCSLGRVCRKVLKYAECSVLVCRPPRDPASTRLRMLLAFDDSPAASAAVDQLAELPLGDRVELTLLSVLTVATTFYSEDVLERLSNAWQQYRRDAKSSLEAAAAKLLPVAPNTSTRLVDGGPGASDEILEAIESANADLAIVGRTGKSGFRKFLLGSVSSDVLEDAPCSVWVVAE